MCFDSLPDVAEEATHGFHSLCAQIKPDQIPTAFVPSPDHLTTIIYTSGTTGNPKVGDTVFSSSFCGYICMYIPKGC
jgi:acyl-coenzyme A synthetase/AMP-(fatty) acid ligase